MSNGKKSWLLTGCGSGFGSLLAQAVLDIGDQVAATDLRIDMLSSLKTSDPSLLFKCDMDVTDWESIDHAVQATLSHFGEIDVLVNNAGIGLGGPYEENDWPQIRKVMEVNALGTMAVTRAVLPFMREKARGRIINISSDSGLFGQPLQTAYCASKFAIEGFSESLAHELAPLGIFVSIIEPCGMYATAMPRNAIADAERRSFSHSPYRGMVEGMMKLAKAGLEQAQNPQMVIDAIMEAANLPEPPLRLPVGPEDRLHVIHARHQMPDADFIRMIREHLLPTTH
ncbi:SDR family oxidoreductase [bacterium]|nr:SDR family oxidoreductase [bacterium]